MAPNAVLAIGIDPWFADFSAMPQLTPELIHAYILAEIARVRALGFDVALLLIAPGEKAEADVAEILQSKDVACVVIGAGLREPPEHLLLFEKIVNLVRRLAPAASIAFNTTPADTAEAVLRWMTRRDEVVSR